MHRNPRSAITVFELLVALAVIAILLGLMLPLIMRLRLIAARVESQNNMKQIGISMHAYHDVRGTMPPGVDANNISAFAYVLPYIEQNNLYNQIDFNKDVSDKANKFVRATRINVYVSPLDSFDDLGAKFGPTNYFLCAGSKHSLTNNNGMYYSGSNRRFADITDGSSNTIWLGESLRGDGGKKAVTVKRQHIDLAKGKLATLKKESGVTDFKMGKNIAGNRGFSWMDGRFLQSTYTATRSLNDVRPDVNCSGMGGLSSLRSESLNTINVGAADGSVHVIAEHMNFAPWPALSTVSGGEVIPNW